MRTTERESERSAGSDTTLTSGYPEPKSASGQSVVTNLGTAFSGLSFDELKGSATEKTKTDTGKSLEPVASKEIQPTVLKEPSVNLRQALSDSVSLIDSTASDFKSSLTSLTKSRGGGRDLSDGLVDLEKIKTAVFIGRAINDLMKTKIEALKLCNDIGEETFEPVREEEK